MGFSRRPKYGNNKTYVGELRFDSKLEAARWQQLELMQNTGLISELVRQVPTRLIVNGVRISTMRVDYVYKLATGQIVYEDAKGFPDPAWKLRWKLAKALFPQYEFRVYPERDI